MDKHYNEDEAKRTDTNYCQKHPAVYIPPSKYVVQDDLK